MTKQSDYIPITQKNCISNDNDGRMIERNFVEIQGTFLVKIRDNTFNEAIGENMFEHINKFLEAVGPIKINEGDEERRDGPTFEPSVCKIRIFEMMKYSFNVDEEYIAIKESEYLNHSKDNLNTYRELLGIIDEGWVMETPNEE
nr:hypothetical protein [Tanacetum cinerariifolium]